MAGFMIAAPRSGSGKTMVTCGILELLKRKQKNPFSYKCGPDYIDGLFHRKVLGIEGGNLDSFFEQPQDIREKYAAVSETHFPVVEGVMGYFDGLGGDTTAASSWEVADILNLPVVLVVDAKGASLSLAALIKGFQVFQGESQSSQANKNGNHIQAVILNRISPMLYPRMKAVIEKETGVLVAGYVPELDFWQVGSRHLGLVLPGEIENLQEQMRQLGDCLEKTLDVDVLLKLGEKADIDVLGSVTVTADGSSQKCEAQKNADLVLQNQFAGEKISHSAIPIRLALPGMKLSASTIGTIWNFWKNRAFRSSSSALSMISIFQMIWMVFYLAAVIRSFMQKRWKKMRPYEMRSAGKQRKICPFWQSAAVISIF